MLIGPTLGRYFAVRFAKMVLAVFGTVFGLVYTLDFVELMRRAGDAEGASAALMARLALFRTPAVAEQVLPFAVLFGAMVVLLQLSRKLELVVARAAGISAWQFLQPGFFVALMLGLISIGAYNPMSAYLKQKASEIEAKIFAKSERMAASKDIWIRQKDTSGQLILHSDIAIENSSRLARVTAFVFDASGTFIERIEAQEARLHEGYWDLKEARVLTPDDEPQSYGHYLITTTLEPDQMKQSFTSPESVPFWNLTSTIERTERAGLDATRYRLQRDILTARPMLFLAMVLVAASVSLRFFRAGGVAKMVLGGVAAGFMLYVATQLMAELGSSGLIRTWIAAWFPALVGSLLGALALLYTEDG